MRLERVFLDSNVLVSAIISHGNENAVLGLALDDKIRVVVSEFVLGEVRRVIGEKFPERLRRMEEALFQLECELVAAADPLLTARAAALVRDPGDVEVLAAILAAKPDIALTGDKDLLTDEVKAVAPTRRCAEYLESLEREE